MKKTIVTLSIAILFGFYLIYQHHSSEGAVITPNQSVAVQDSGNNTYSASSAVDSGSGDANTTQSNSASAPIPTPAPTPTPNRAPTPVPLPAPAPAPKPKGQYADGSYTGSVEDAYYGNIQVRATISGGKLISVQFLQYPNDRSNSIFINRQAMPYLSSEAIQAQSANVDVVSGATDTSTAFQRSLTNALAQAKS